MKNVLTTVALLATASLISACSGSGSSGGDSNPAPAPVADPNAKPQAQVQLVGSTFRGIDAYCADGTKAEKVKESVLYKVLSFGENGKFVSEVSKGGNEISSVEGSYTVEGNVITMTSGTVSEKVTYKIEGEELTMDSGPAKDGSCPAGQILYVKYTHVQPEADAEILPAPGPDSEVMNQAPRAPSRVPKPD